MNTDDYNQIAVEKIIWIAPELYERRRDGIHIYQY